MNHPRLPGMEQASNLRKQDIRRIVSARLEGLETRQKIRDHIRQIRKNRRENPSHVETQEEFGIMRSPIVFRASFQQPKNSVMRLSAEIAVEVYHERIGPPAAWRARVPGKRILFKDIAEQGVPGILMRQIAAVHFERQVKEWQAYDRSQDPPRLLDKTDWYEDRLGQVYLSDGYREKLERERLARAEAGVAERKRQALEEML
jgi:hypothetical protein